MGKAGRAQSGTCEPKTQDWTSQRPWKHDRSARRTGAAEVFVFLLTPGLSLFCHTAEAFLPKIPEGCRNIPVLFRGRKILAKAEAQDSGYEILFSVLKLTQVLTRSLILLIKPA